MKWNIWLQISIILFYNLPIVFFVVGAKWNTRKLFFVSLNLTVEMIKREAISYVDFAINLWFCFANFLSFFCVCIGWKSFFLLFSLPSFCWFFSLVWGLNFLWIVKLSVTIFRSFFLLLFLYKTDKNLLLFVIISTMGNEL